jgi:hypothetical protein
VDENICARGFFEPLVGADVVKVAVGVDDMNNGQLDPRTMRVRMRSASSPGSMTTA